MNSESAPIYYIFLHEDDVPFDIFEFRLDMHSENVSVEDYAKMINEHIYVESVEEEIENYKKFIETKTRFNPKWTLYFKNKEYAERYVKDYLDPEDCSVFQVVQYKKTESVSMEKVLCNDIRTFMSTSDFHQLMKIDKKNIHYFPGNNTIKGNNIEIKFYEKNKLAFYELFIFGKSVKGSYNLRLILEDLIGNKTVLSLIDTGI